MRGRIDRRPAAGRALALALMAVQAVSSLMILGLVIARAVNILK